MITLLATSLGRVNVAVRTGELTPATPLPTLARTLDCNLNGAKTQVLYAGLMPGLAGIYQLSILIPAEFPLGTTWGGNIGAPPLQCSPVPRSELDYGSFQADIPVEF